MHIVHSENRHFIQEEWTLNGQTVSIITVCTVGTGTMYFNILANQLIGTIRQIESHMCTSSISCNFLE